MDYALYIQYWISYSHHIYILTVNNWKIKVIYYWSQQARSEDPAVRGGTGSSKRVLGFMHDGKQTCASRRWKKDIERTDTDRVSVQEPQKGKEGISFLFGVWGFLLRMEFWYTHLLRHPGMDWNKDKGSGVTPWSQGFLALRNVAPVVWNVHVIASSGHSHLVLP